MGHLNKMVRRSVPPKRPATIIARSRQRMNKSKPTADIKGVVARGEKK